MSLLAATMVQGGAQRGTGVLPTSFHHSGARLCRLQQLHPYGGGGLSLPVTDGRCVCISQSTALLTATILTPWAPVDIPLSVVISLGVENVFILGRQDIQRTAGHRRDARDQGERDVSCWN